MESRRKALFIDIDGCILKHQGSATASIMNSPTILDGVLNCFNSWSGKGYQIILTTGRNESMRSVTESQLRSVGLFWDLLIMGVGTGERILINDFTDPQSPKAIGINVRRNEGFENIDDLYNDTKIRLGCPAGNVFSRFVI